MKENAVTVSIDGKKSWQNELTNRCCRTGSPLRSKPAAKRDVKCRMSLAKLIILWSFIMSGASAEDLYFTATGEEDGKPLIFRSLHSVPKGSVESDYPFLISVYWAYKAANEGGMPDAETNEAQIAFEDALEHLDKTGISHLMLVVTG